MNSFDDEAAENDPSVSSSELQLDMILPLILGEGWTLAAFAPLGPLLDTPLRPPDPPLGGPPQAPDPDEILSLSIDILKELFESPASEGLCFRFRRLLDCDRLSDLLPPDFDCFFVSFAKQFFL